MNFLLRLCFTVLAAFAAHLPTALADDAPYPTKPIRFIVPFGPGGGGDVVARILGQKLAARFGTPVVIDNRPGAGATLGTDIAAKSSPDGYTILLGNVGPLAIAVSLYKSLPYDPMTDFTPISMIVVYPNILVIHPSVPARSVTELVALAKAQPGKLIFASAGNGTSPHFAAELFKSMAGIDMLHVPYKGGGQAVVNLIAGHVHMYFSSVVGALPHVKSGKLEALAVTSAKRSRTVPALPTVAESGFPGFEADNWLGVVAPKGTAKPIVARLHREIVGALQQSDMEEKLSAQGAEATVSSPQGFSAYIASEIKKWSKVVKESGAQVE